MSTATDAGRDAAAILKDYAEATCDSTKRLANLDKHKSHVSRGFSRLIKTDIELQRIVLPLSNSDGECVYEAWPVLSPHVLWRFLSVNGALLEILSSGIDLADLGRKLAPSSLGKTVLKNVPGD